MFYSKKKYKLTGKDILNEISHYISFIIIVTAIVLYFRGVYTEKARVYDYIELRHNFKNCIIVGKTDTNENYTLLLHNPILHKDSQRETDILYIDYKVRVRDYTYFHNFIGDIIK